MHLNFSVNPGSAVHARASEVSSPSLPTKEEERAGERKKRNTIAEI
jgi:hypothetical protein